ncbi:hypothetical protein CHLRE_06g306200v5 [Chlamydomonas reinhardtii]|uniref:Uncharacterized protein n=1 Tax=Chlamydomonas reinhardtii TaxID=3055 RepID=A0A2K3DRB8_CHLRE|nr:uncharacterized protein CHLRE_06g306200v5 [Chlamydomonas reinhardtii]PNW83092.1 hypothetical protein CHLRE_06g306200v5 [Chlamydomonas reinhardtii]
MPKQRIERNGGPSRAIRPRSLATITFLIILSSITGGRAAYNATAYKIAAGGKYVSCGWYTIDATMWADSTSAWMYLTDLPCDPLTQTPCKPPSDPALTPVSCVGLATCERSTSAPSAVPLCLVVANTDAGAVLTINLDVQGSQVPVDAGGGGGSSGPLSDYEIILIAVGGGVGCLILLTLVGLISWLMCCRRPPQGQVHPLVPNDDMALLAAKSRAATPAFPPGMGPRIMTGTMTLLPPPVAGLPAYGPRSLAGPHAALSPGRSAAFLAPLPTTAYGALPYNSPGASPGGTGAIPAARPAQ